MPLFKRAPLFHLPQEMEPPKSDKTFLTTSSQFGEHSGQVELRSYPPLHSGVTQMLSVQHSHSDLPLHWNAHCSGTPWMEPGVTVFTLLMMMMSSPPVERATTSTQVLVCILYLNLFTSLVLIYVLMPCDKDDNFCPSAAVIPDHRYMLCKIWHFTLWAMSFWVLFYMTWSACL